MMRFAIVLCISFIAGNYALSPPLADIGMTPDYALGDGQVDLIELELGGDYVNMNINQYEKEEHYIMEEMSGHRSQEESSRELHQLDTDHDYHHHYDKFRHPHNGGHYTLPVETNPTI